MTDLSGHDRLRADLIADLRPVRTLRSPWRRGALWIAVVLALAVGLALPSDLPAVVHRLMIVPDMWLAVLGSAATAILAALAAFPLSVLIVVSLRRGYAIHPSLTGAVAGLAVAATLLDLFHPFDARLDDLAVHALAVLIVIAANRLLGGSLLARKSGIRVAR